MDPSKEVPEEIKIIDLQKKMKKKRFDLRYNLEDQYRVKFTKILRKLDKNF